MKKTVLLFGLIIGAILCINMVIMVNMIYGQNNLKGNDVVGYAAMVVLFSLIFFGVRNYRINTSMGLSLMEKPLK